MGRLAGRHIAILSLVVLCGIGTVLLIESFDHVALILLLPLMFAIAAVPIGMKIARGTFDLFEITVPYSVMYLSFYGAGAVFVLLVKGVASDGRVVDYLDLGVAYCTLGLASVMFGYWVSGRVIPVRTVAPGPRVGWSLLAGIYTIGLIGKLFSATIGARSLHWMTVTGFESFVSQLAFLSTLTLFYAIFLVMSKTASKAHTLLLFGWMAPTTLISLVMFVGNKTSVVLHGILPFIAYWYIHRRVPWKSLTAFALIVVFVLFPVYYTYRHFDKAHYSRGIRFEKAIGELRKQDSTTYAENAMTSVAKRLAIIDSTTVVIRECGSRVDYQMGTTLWLGVVTLAIPRILWPDKPTVNIGQWFGRTFHITGFYNYSYVTISMVGELYWNFHIAGVVVGMFVFGLVLRAIYVRFGAQGGANPFRLSIYVVILFSTVLNSEGGIGALEGSLARQLVIMLLLEKALIVIDALGERRHTESGASSDFAVVR